jgi:hypothetical protein
MVEQGTHNPLVAGSSPAGPTMTDEEWEELKRKHGVPSDATMVPIFNNPNQKVSRAYLEKMHEYCNQPEIKESVKAALKMLNSASKGQKKPVTPDPNKKYRSIDDDWNPS